MVPIEPRRSEFLAEHRRQPVPCQGRLGGVVGHSAGEEFEPLPQVRLGLWDDGENRLDDDGRVARRRQLGLLSAGGVTSSNGSRIAAASAIAWVRSMTATRMMGS